MTRILFINFKKYSTILEGGGIANQRNIDAARQLFGEQNVDVEYLHNEQEMSSLITKLCNLFWMMLGYWNGLSPHKIGNLLQQSNQYDYIFLSSSLFGKIAKYLHNKHYTGQVITHFHNVESIYYASCNPWYNPLRWISVMCASKNDYLSCRYADTIITLNERDSAQLYKLYHRRADFVIPIAIKDTVKGYIDCSQLTSSPLRCTFIGSNFSANSEGVVWFVRNVLPHVNIQFRIVGKNMAQLKAKEPLLKNIEVVNNAEDLGYYYAHTDVMVMPIFKGSGMKVKTCEALMYGKNIFGTTEAFEGYNIDHQYVGALCNTAQDFIDAIHNWTSHPRPQFNAYSRQYFEQHIQNSNMIFSQIFKHRIWVV